eukprot:m.44644 g.44644  ORF g.44644 m.44644 type:complete len:277 (-) comp10615_c0_seq1:1297-2127(-)
MVFGRAVVDRLFVLHGMRMQMGVTWVGACARNGAVKREVALSSFRYYSNCIGAKTSNILSNTLKSQKGRKSSCLFDGVFVLFGISLFSVGTNNRQSNESKSKSSWIGSKEGEVEEEEDNLHMSPQVANLIVLGRKMALQDELEAAAKCYEDALDAAKKEDLGLQVKGGISYRLAHVYSRMYRYADALEHYNQCLSALLWDGKQYDKSNVNAAVVEVGQEHLICYTCMCVCHRCFVCCIYKYDNECIHINTYCNVDIFGDGFTLSRQEGIQQRYQHH